MNEWMGFLLLELVGGVKTWKEEELTAVVDWRRVSCVFHDGAFNAPIIAIVSAGWWESRRVTRLVRQATANFHILRPREDLNYIAYINHSQAVGL